MNTLTISLPDDVAERLASAAKARGVSVNAFITEISVQALAVHDAETRFKLIAAEADIPAAIAVLDRLDGGR
ncbi:MAG: ribbon-helix-helix domain-containing protein [Planctomycetaceae bacterium]|nr:ribbon-helix-helix domain-containing protein [Planctomycetaceae bacterium]